MFKTPAPDVESAPDQVLSENLVPLSHFELDHPQPPEGWPAFLGRRAIAFVPEIWAATVFAVETLAGCWTKSAQMSFGRRSIARWRKLRRLRLTGCGCADFGRVCRRTECLLVWRRRL